ncbi:hypothetical protein [Arenibacter palladensis]|uniref:hypothetical protein n=1 Tax=Arenibacter palladensis TaxID=237373 RepID=UPI0026E1E034|nr:hypothetical protein [Arenibacter palladensis]MDO6603197.1 hypothetical protein [Arenibacter palladensis]
MKKPVLLLGTVLTSLLLFSFSGKVECPNNLDSDCLTNTSYDPHNPFMEGLLMDEEVRNLSIEDINFIEDEEEIVLNFDPTLYLPLDFNAYMGMGLDLDTIVVEDLEEDIVLGFDPAQYLPIGFNAYEGMELDLNDIVVEEIEEEIDLGFEVMNYLPKGFNAYSK